eukprot:TRINITY_DN1468_c0_g1_i2.p2 TRINITY_DN1468_c0_g1~~TRINITY_DN1468_c0_g1_i2.p2  ORF type:complete len:378 (-),score=52.60 TRINITY_DN1468_c0_g1_i2:61-1194(-)
MQSLSLWDQMGYSDSPEIQTGDSVSDKPRTDTVLAQLNAKLVPKAGVEQKLVTSVFEAQQGYSFERLSVPDVPSETQSMLSLVIGTMRMLDINTTFHVPGCDMLYNVIITVPESATFIIFLKYLLKKFNSEHPDRQVEEVINAYIVQVGNIEGVYRQKEGIKKYAHLQFIVKEDPKYAKGPKKDKIVLRVSLPTGIYRTMAFQPNQKMHAVLTGVCTKSKLDPTEHLLYYEGVMVSRDLTVNDIASGELTLVERSSVQPSIETDEPTDIFWYGKLARKYKRYHVMYYKKGIKSKVEEVVLGIDGEHIAMTIKKKGTKKQSTRYNISEVSKCELLQASARFTLEIGKLVFQYEAPNNDIAREIVGKVKYLMKMHVDHV